MYIKHIITLNIYLPVLILNHEVVSSFMITSLPETAKGIAIDDWKLVPYTYEF